MKELLELRGQLKVANDKLKALFDESKGADGVESLANIKSVDDPKGEIERLMTEQRELTPQIVEYETIEKGQLETAETEEYLKSINKPLRPNLGGSTEEPVKAPFKSIGDLYIASPEYKAVNQARSGDGDTFTAKMSLPELFFSAEATERRAVRALFDSTDFDPFESHDMQIVGRPWGGPRMFLNMIPQIPINSDTVLYHRLTTRTEPSSYSIADGAVYPEGTFEYTRETATVIARGWFVPVSEWVEEDNPAAVMEINRDLMTGVARQIAGYATTLLLGTAGNLSSKTTLSAGAESATSAIYNMITRLRVTADTEPNMISMHPNDWAKIVTEQSAMGDYLFSGMANQQMMMTRWGLPVATDVGVTEGRVLVLDSNAVRLRDRRAVNVRTAMNYRVSSNLTLPTGQMLHFADARFAFYARFPQGVGDLTL